jgi:hypothetical protein
MKPQLHSPRLLVEVHPREMPRQTPTGATSPMQAPQHHTPHKNAQAPSLRAGFAIANAGKMQTPGISRGPGFSRAPTCAGGTSAARLGVFPPGGGLAARGTRMTAGSSRSTRGLDQGLGKRSHDVTTGVSAL